ncbi:MAG: hypothetical protein AYK22_03825 [Thermoplasmatales archaeon SG8-52-3]|nr:MAG: hypothetical protein AYK22_03825 [Thermoplasmatales archaeon SG8-52-3]
MRFNKSFITLVFFLLLFSTLNINSLAISLSYDEIKSEIKNFKFSSDEYIIQLNDEPIFSFINKLNLFVKNIYFNLNEKINDSLLLSKIKDYKKNLISNHIKTKQEILKLFDIRINKDNLFLRDFYDLFNGFLIKKITEEEMLKIKKLPNVKNIFPNYKIYSTLDRSIPLINANDVWKIKDDFGNNLTGEEITIAILDTGVDYNHVDLRDNYISDGSFDFVNNDSDPMDDNGHGTHVTGIAVGKGYESNFQYIGVAPDAMFYSFKILDSNGEGNFSSYYDAMMRTLDPNNDGDYSDKVDIVSLSFGTKIPGNPDDNLCQILDNVADAGVIVVAAAGNLGPNSNSITSPGCARKSICVGSIDKNEIIAYSSSRGPVEWDGNFIEKPDIVAPGVNIKSTKLNGGYEFNSGTSMATPHVSGAIALIKQAYYKLNSDEIKQVLMKTSKDIGYDINTQGKGRIDVLNSIKTNKKFIIKAPEKVNESEYFKIQIFDNNYEPINLWTLILIPFHLTKIKYGQSLQFIAPLIISNKVKFVNGKIIAFKFKGGFEFIKKDIVIVNNI